MSRSFKKNPDLGLESIKKAYGRLSTKEKVIKETKKDIILGK